MEPKLSAWLENDQVAILTDAFKVFDKEGATAQHTNFEVQYFVSVSAANLDRQWQDQQGNPWYADDIAGKMSCQ